MNLKFLRSINFSKKTIINGISFLLLAYFAFHSIYGDRGVISYFSLNQKLARSFEELEHLKGKRIDLQHKTKLLRLESLDKDMLDERARNVLGVASPNEQVYQIKTEN